MQIKEGLNCFFCLVPYDVITFEVGLLACMVICLNSNSPDHEFTQTCIYTRTNGFALTVDLGLCNALLVGGH